MLDFSLTQINGVAVIVAALLAFTLGAPWYTVWFGRSWLAANLISSKRLEALGQSPWRLYALMLLVYLSIALVLAWLVTTLEIHHPGHGAIFGALLALGVSAPLGLIANLLQEKPILAFLIDALFQITVMALMAALLAVWQ